MLNNIKNPVEIEFHDLLKVKVIGCYPSCLQALKWFPKSAFICIDWLRLEYASDRQYKATHSKISSWFRRPSLCSIKLAYWSHLLFFCKQKLTMSQCQYTISKLFGMGKKVPKSQSAKGKSLQRERLNIPQLNDFNLSQNLRLKSTFESKGKYWKFNLERNPDIVCFILMGSEFWGFVSGSASSPLINSIQ